MAPGDFLSFIYLGRCYQLISFISPLPLVLNTGPSVPILLIIYSPNTPQPHYVLGSTSGALAGEGEGPLAVTLRGWNSAEELRSRAGPRLGCALVSASGPRTLGVSLTWEAQEAPPDALSMPGAQQGAGAPYTPARGTLNGFAVPTVEGPTQLRGYGGG